MKISLNNFYWHSNQYPDNTHRSPKNIFGRWIITSMVIILYGIKKIHGRYNILIANTRRRRKSRYYLRQWSMELYSNNNKHNMYVQYLQQKQTTTKQEQRQQQKLKTTTTPHDRGRQWWQLWHDSSNSRTSRYRKWLR